MYDWFSSGIERARRGLRSGNLSEHRQIGWLHSASVVLLWCVLIVYLVAWAKGHWGLLTDPLLQTDDARTVLFPFHRFGPEGLLANDPIASEMSGFAPYFVRGLYWFFVQISDLYWASKWVQLLALSVLFYASYILLKARHAGLAVAALLLFLTLHFDYAVSRLGGGLPRAFAFPTMALWLAGALANRQWPRFVAAGLAALTYAPAMLMILAAEGIHSVRAAAAVPWNIIFNRLRRYALLVLGCGLLLLPFILEGDGERGPLHTLEQAREEPAFGQDGRLKQLPFPNPVSEVGIQLSQPFKVNGWSPFPALQNAYGANQNAIVLVMLACLLLAVYTGLAPLPRPMVALLCGSVILHLLAGMLAFKLYSPLRFLTYGVSFSGIALAVGVLGFLFYKQKRYRRTPYRNLAATLFMVGLWVTAGDGIRPKSGMTIDYRGHLAMWEYIKTLPTNVRIASHPMDGDNIPYFTGRANMGGFETLQPWYLDAWSRQKERAQETLDALYATDPQTVSDFVARHGVTHLFINPTRYQGDLARNARTFEPLSSYTAELLKSKEPYDLVFSKVPENAISFKDHRFILVDVNKLEKAWSTQAADPAERP